MRLVVKLGSSSVTRPDGSVDLGLMELVAEQVAAMRGTGHEVVLVSSGAIAAGWSAIGEGRPRPSDAAVLQAVSAVGQHRLTASWQEAFERFGIHVGQVLLAPYDFVHREQYLFARSTLEHLLTLGAVPIVNENDATADEEIRFGDNDRIAALVAQLVGAEQLLLLTDTAGLFTADPRRDASATLIEEVAEIDEALEAMATGTGSEVGSGGMASKLAAARIATWSGVAVTIASAREPGVLAAVVAGEPVGTRFIARRSTLSARKLWIAFALPSRGTLHVDAGAVAAMTEGGSSLLAVGVTSVEGGFEAGQAVEVRGPDGTLVAKGLAELDAAAVMGSGATVLHRDELVLLAD